MSGKAQRQVTDLPIGRAFAPALKATTDGRSEADGRKLEYVQRATRAEIERYEGYGSAEEVVTDFKRKLHSAAAKKVPAALRALKLPVVYDFRDEFDRTAHDLGVHV